MMAPKKTGWALSCAIALLGLVVLASMVWSTRHGHPRGPVGAIVAGLIMYAGVALRLVGGVGAWLFKPARKGASLALTVWAVVMSALYWLELPPYSWEARLVFLTWIGCALACDMWLLSFLRKPRTSPHS